MVEAAATMCCALSTRAAKWSCITRPRRNETADEVDRVAADGLKTTRLITNVDRRAKTMSIRVRTRGAELCASRSAQPRHRQWHRRRRAGTAKVIVYVNDEAGRPVAHYFKRVS